MLLKDFKISSVDTSKGLTLGEYKAEEKVKAKAYGTCGMSLDCSGGGGQCGMGLKCAGQ